LIVGAPDRVRTREDFGCEVITAASGTDALEQLSGDHRIEILITNLNMPGMTDTNWPKGPRGCTDSQGDHAVRS
jgi:CheY-like chemotaxis protein